MKEQSKRTGEHRITSIRENKKGKMEVSFGYYSLTLGSNAFTEFPLYEGKLLSENEYRRLKELEKNENNLNYAIKLCSKGTYSAHEVREKLKLRNVEEKEISFIMKTLNEYRLIDDEQLAKDYKEAKEAELYGEERILEELRFKKCIAEKYLSKLRFKDEKKHAERFLKTLEKRLASLPYKSKLAKARDALSRRGFSNETIGSALSIIKEDKALVKKRLKDEAIKCKRRYERKYSGYELREHCFAYLYSKGYPTQEINKSLEEIL